MITRKVKQAFGAGFDSIYPLGELVHGFVRFTQPAHVVVAIEDPGHIALAGYIGLALKENGFGGATMIGPDATDQLRRLGVSMQVIKGGADYEVPLQHDLNLLVTDTDELRARFYDRLASGALAICPNIPGTGGSVDTFRLSEGVRLWHK